MDYKDQIRSKLHPSFAGLRDGPGLIWLDEALNRLDTEGMNLTVKNFLHAMNRLDGVNGFLLEIETALAILDAFPGSTVSSERTDGTAKKPCDITLETSTFRADLQCKSVNNIYSEHFVEEFIAWVEETYATATPGQLFELQPNRQADEQTFRELRDWFAARWATLDLETEYEFLDFAQRGKIWITMLPSDTPGVGMGLIGSATDDSLFAADEDEALVRKVLLNRIKMARSTFGFDPGSRQFNFVVVDLPSLNISADEESLVTALYGSEKIVQVSPSNFRALTQPDGLFTTHTTMLGYCSGVAFRDGRQFDTSPFILYPNVPYVEAVRQEWDRRGAFHITNKISL